MRIVFFGTPDFAVPSLLALAGARHEIAAVVCRPDRPSGRGLAPQRAAVAETAHENGWRLHQPERVNSPESIAAIRELRPELLVVVAFGAILKPELLALAPGGAINVHGSLLPAYRGAAPIQRALAAGESFTGITTIYLSEEMDAGDIILQQCVPVSPHEDAGSLSTCLAATGAGLLVETLRLIQHGEAPRIPQDSSRATFAPRIRKEEGHLDWSLGPIALHNRIRAMTPWPGALTRAAGRALLVRESSPVDLIARTEVDPGTVLEIAKGDGPMIVQTGEGALALHLVQPENKRVMHGGEFARGARLSPGSRLGES